MWSSPRIAYHCLPHRRKRMTVAAGRDYYGNQLSMRPRDAGALCSRWSDGGQHHDSCGGGRVVACEEKHERPVACRKWCGMHGRVAWALSRFAAWSAWHVAARSLSLSTIPIFRPRLTDSQRFCPQPKPC